MRITFACPYCGKKLAASETSAGREKTCPNCRARVVVPSPATAADSVAKAKVEPRTASDHPLLLMGRRPEHKDLIDMTAMVDIVFFLLIFFLVTSMQSIQAVINLPAPQATSGSPDSVQAVPDLTNDPNFVVVTIDADDSVWIDEQQVMSEQDLRAKLRTAVKENDREEMMINGAADSTHGKFVMVLDAGADAGMKKIQFSVPRTDESRAGG